MVIKADLEEPVLLAWALILKLPLPRPDPPLILNQLTPVLARQLVLLVTVTRCPKVAPAGGATQSLVGLTVNRLTPC